MANKFNAIVGILKAFIVLMLLNGCNNGIQMSKVNETKKNDEVLDYAKATSEKLKAEHGNALCPSCEGRYRYFLRLTNNAITVYCEECSSIWLDPSNIAWDGVASYEMLEKRFNVEDAEILFDEDSSDWATEQEVKRSPWNGHEQGIPIKNRNNNKSGTYSTKILLEDSKYIVAH